MDLLAHAQESAHFLHTTDLLLIGMILSGVVLAVWSFTND